MKSEPEGKKEKKDEDEEKTQKKSDPAANLRPREPGGLGRASPRLREPLVARAWPRVTQAA